MSGARGVASEDVVELDRKDARTVRRRSLRLLGSLLKPVHLRVAVLVVAVVVGQSARAAGPALVAIAVNDALPTLVDGDAGPVLGYGAAYALVAITAATLGWATIRLTSWISQTALLDLRRRVFLHVQRLDLEFHERYTSGRTISRQTSDLDSIRELLDGGANQLLTSFVYMAFIAALLTALDPLSGAVLLVSALPVGLLTRWFHRMSQRYYRSGRIASANVIVHFVETMTGIRAVQAFRREQFETERHRRRSEALQEADVRSLGLNGTYDPGLILIGNLTVVAILALDGWRALQGDLPVGTLIAAILYAKRFFTPVEQMARFYDSLQAAVASLEKISGLLEEVPAVAEPTRSRPLPSAREGDARGSGEIVLDDVRFGYEGSAGDVLEASVRVPAGETVAIVGATGAGKSTLAKLVTRFYDVERGQVRIDGVDVREVADAELRRAVVMVTQESFLFTGSVAANIELGKPGAGREEVVAAARAVGADAFIRTLPEGYDTDVRGRGVRLSAGQRQLVSFARAFIADPRVLILDEATASLDLPSEAAVQRALKTLLRDRTAIIIAHRLSTVDIADRVLVLRAGRIIEDGAPAALEAIGGEYAQMREAWTRATTTATTNSG